MVRYACFLVPWVLSALSIDQAGAASSGGIVVKVVMKQDEKGDPAATGKGAAEALKTAMGETALKAVLVSECFEDREAKEQLLRGICSVLPRELVVGGATYGSFTQAGCTDADAVCLLGLGGDGLAVSRQLVTGLGTSKLTMDENRDLIAQRLHAAGERLANSIQRSGRDRLLILIADAHSPKNQFLVEGLQKVLGSDFPITGGCVNKNVGQTYVYSGGELSEDSALALMLSGDFHASLAGRQANVNDLVISTAKEAARQALDRTQGRPVAVLAFNCAGRRSKLKKYEDELAAIQTALGTNLPLFGCYCAGEMGPVDDPQKTPGANYGGAGWHVMFTVLAQ